MTDRSAGRNASANGRCLRGCLRKAKKLCNSYVTRTNVTKFFIDFGGRECM